MEKRREIQNLGRAVIASEVIDAIFKSYDIGRWMSIAVWSAVNAAVDKEVFTGQRKTERQLCGRGTKAYINDSEDIVFGIGTSAYLGTGGGAHARINASKILEIIEGEAAPEGSREYIEWKLYKILKG